MTTIKHTKLFVLAAAVVAVLAFAGPALADSATFTVTTTDGQADPAAGVPRVFTLSGATSSPKYVYLKYRNTGGAPCAASAYADTGDDWYSFWEKSVNGSFSFKVADTWDTPGDVLFCIWIADSSNKVTTPIAQTITFRAPGGTIAGAINPTAPQPNESFTVTVSGSSESTKQVYATIKEGATCAPTYGSDQGSSVIDGDSVNGNYNLTATRSGVDAGSYVLCLWLASGSSDTAPVAGPQPITFTVASPPPPPPPPAPAISAACLSAKSQVARWSSAVVKTKSQIRRVHSSKAKRKLRKKLAAQRRTLGRAKDRVTINC